ncbi:hypothetical protein [Jeotgalibacillus terrae]|uniref:Uncharacterized protein n=1 Tax=Jeotgalibacillus terrae TaxID=587735 RepID=A0ABW5ZF55_9BACL|nr:hypothetical protein [Jeotgalibacillus terrae]MBM7580011.1 hypothetical protein [Jeotgalibacillus terrae]
MIQLELQSELKRRLENTFQDVFFNDLAGNRVPLNVYEQNLPKKQSEEEEFFPFVIVKLLEAEKKKEKEPYITSVGFVIGTVDSDVYNQGYRDTANIINRIIENLEKQPIVKGQFTLSGPLKWVLHEEDTGSYYFGAVEASFETPELNRVDLEAMI